MFLIGYEFCFTQFLEQLIIINYKYFKCKHYMQQFERNKGIVKIDEDKCNAIALIN